MNEERRIDRYEKVPYTEIEFSEIYGVNNDEWLSAMPYTGIESNNIDELPQENTTEMPSYSIGDTLPSDIALYLIRKKRNLLIKDSDYRVLPDYPINDDQKLEWKMYRQKLRDITGEVDLNNIIMIEINGNIEAGGFEWPTPPS